MAKISVRQVKSIIGSPKTKKLTMKALGLGKMNKTVTLETTPQVTGMLNKVHNLIEVKEI